jgi:hypothetical protein
MFTKITSAFAIFSNLGKIKLVASSTYTVIVRLLAVMKFIQTQITDTKLGEVLDKYMPATINALETVKNLAEKYGAVLGITPAIAAQSVGSDLEAELKASVQSLKQHA